ncbi:MAG: copper chaperone [Halonotius sp. J07HN6]|jgi:Copper chaperone|nr:MAG: copper chaperone [Halonotius sp. J07HN6]ESS08121.1 MAG: copper chaperone [uncultured archaeon A07HN63]
MHKPFQFLRSSMSQTITVEGMSCAHCEETVEGALESLADVTAASADHETDAVDVEGSARTDELLRAVADAGYEASA